MMKHGAERDTDMAVIGGLTIWKSAPPRRGDGPYTILWTPNAAVVWDQASPLRFRSWRLAVKEARAIVEKRGGGMVTVVNRQYTSTWSAQGADVADTDAETRAPGRDFADDIEDLRTRAQE